MNSRRERLRARVFDGSGEREVTVTGNRNCQALRALVQAGQKGVTALELSTWALRLAHYCYCLRKDYGITINTEYEEHDGGFHGRYRLACRVEILPTDPAASVEVAA